RQRAREARRAGLAAAGTAAAQRGDRRLRRRAARPAARPRGHRARTEGPPVRPGPAVAAAEGRGGEAMTASMLRSPFALALPAPARLALARPALIGLLLLAACGDKEAAPGADPKLFVVKRADLPITVTENAELQAQRETIIRSEIEGQATIIWIVPEGTQVA